MFQWGGLPADRQHAETGLVSVCGHSELETSRILCAGYADFGIPVPCAKGRLSRFDRT